MLELEEIVKLALKEDAYFGDITTEALGIGNKHVKAEIVAKEEGVLCGMNFVRCVFSQLNVRIVQALEDGELLYDGRRIALLEGKAKDILKGERIALNFIQRFSGIATLTKAFVDELEGTKTKLLDTRKTTPLLRKWEKYAVRIGGGMNHRLTLYDAILIKDNHRKLFGSFRGMLEKLFENLPYAKKVIVEVESLEELEVAMSYPVDVILLDNFSLREVEEALKIVKGKIPLEVSGGINLNNVRKYALLGVDYVSTGAITHSFRWLDISLEIL